MTYSLTLTELLDTCRNSVLRDLVEEYLWTDARVVTLLNEAYIEFAEATLLLRDASGDYFIELEEGVTTYDYPDEVILVLSARMPGEAYDMTRVARDAAPTTSDTIGWFSTDDGLRTFTVYGVPQAAHDGLEVPLRVARLPKRLFDLTDPTVRCELPRQFAQALPYGAAALAYLDQDSEGGDPARARSMRAIFDSYIRRGQRSARLSMFQPATFGFGGGGFSHT